LINRSNPLQLRNNRLDHPGAIFDMDWSPNEILMATVSSFGSVRVWRTDNWTLVQEIRDHDDGIIDEFYTVAFSRDNSIVIAAGKSKDKKRWNGQVQDYEPLPSSIKLFSISDGKLVLKLEENVDETLCIKRITFDNRQFILSSSKDGKIVKWELTDDLRKVVRKCVIADFGTHIVGDLDFLPNSGNKFFIAAYDKGLKMFDFESEQAIQTLPDLYGFICDCVRFMIPSEFKPNSNEYFLITRGVELENEETQASERPNTCHLHKITLPVDGKGKLLFETLQMYSHQNYKANVWMLKINSNGRYILAPTTNGQVFVWNLRSAELVAILNDHSDREVRTILLHPSRKLMLSCGDDSVVYIYSQPEATPTTAPKLTKPNPNPADTQAHLTSNQNPSIPEQQGQSQNPYELQTQPESSQ